MNFEEFLKPRQDEVTPAEEEVETSAENQVEESESGSAADAAEQSAEEQPVNPLVNEMMGSDEPEEIDESKELEVSNEVVKEFATENAELKEQVKSLRKQVDDLQSKIASLNLKLDEQNIALGKVGETLAKNSETPESSKIALLDRDPELPDRFEGETRDHVLEAIKESRDAAEKDGRLRHAQILESVLCANEPNGSLAKKREELKKLFESNANLVSGPVIEELQKLGISHKNGEDYLLPAEILKRTY